jgi:integrase
MSTTWRAVTPVLLDNFVAHRLKTPSARGFWPKPDTIKRDLQAVRDWLIWNEERELTGPIRSAHTNRPLPQQDREEVHVVTQEQEDFILKRSRWIYEGSRGLRFPEIVNGKEVLHNACQTGWEKGAFRLYFLLMIRCGLRPDEALHMRWDEIYLESNPPFFKLKRMYDEHDKPLRKLKTAKSEDAVSIARYVRPEDRDEWSGASEGVDLVKEIRDFKDQLRTEQKLTPFVFGRLDPFVNNYTFPTDSFIWRALKYECKDNKLKAYSCRHTVGTRLAARGFSSEQIARVLRNTSRVCERYYIAGTRVHDVFDVSTGQRLQIRDVG